MGGRVLGGGLASAVLVASAALLSTPAAAQDGWFSEEQVARGASLYERRCASCHGDEKSENFRVWPDSAQSLIGMIIGFGMPADRPGGLPPQEYVDIVAYVFNLGGLPTGEEVKAGAPELAEIRIK
jgi:alcohol dehydrogenase (cytochrome c)